MIAILDLYTILAYFLLFRKLTLVEVYTVAEYIWKVGS